MASAAAAPPGVVPAKLRVPPADALPRERLAALLEATWEHRLGLVVAPAGSGKTTLLAQFAATASVPVAWYRTETWDADAAALLRHLEAALTAALPGLAGGWGGVDAAARALEAWSGGRALLVIDDLHTLEGTPAEAALARFLDYAPPWLAVLAGSRVAPGLNLSRLRVSGELLEIGADELRFRAWEVERLFRDFYGTPVPPGELAVVARRTEGWAAGLQLFHLATRGKSPEERRRILSGAGSSGRVVRDYLAHNVLAELPPEIRRFLIETSVLGRLSGGLCDRLLGRNGSAALLDELVRRQIFTVELDDADGSFRYHEVLRSHLDRILVDQVGEGEARQRHARAGALLEEARAPAEALTAYCRAEDWPAVRRLLGGQGERLADGARAWLEGLPPAIVRHEPWLALAAARRARAEGRWTEALDGYAAAEGAFGASPTALTCRRERLALAAWLDPVAIPPADWARTLRAGIAREPLAAARETAAAGDVGADGASGALVRGLLALAAGEVLQARRVLTAAAEEPGLGPALAAAARLGEGVALALAGDPAAGPTIDRAVEAAERTGATWLARIGRVAQALAANGGGEAGAAASRPVAFDGDPWGAALAGLIAAWSPPLAAEAVDLRFEAADAAATSFRRLGTGVLEAWARGLAAHALAESGAPEAAEAAAAAASLGRSTGTAAARLLAYSAMAVADPTRTGEAGELAAAVRRETGLLPPRSARPRPARSEVVAAMAGHPNLEAS